MNALIFDAIITRLNADATLLALMGKTAGDDPCYRAQRLSAITPPAVTLHTNTESSTLRPASNASLGIPGTILAENHPTLQIDIWVSSTNSSIPSTGRDADAIADRIDVLLLWNSIGWIPSTHGWRRVSTSQQYEEDQQLWHNALRYDFDYHTMQGYGV